MGRNVDPVHANSAGLSVAWPSLRNPLCTLWRRCSPQGTGASCHGRAGVFLKSHLKLIVPCSQPWVLCLGVTDQGRRGFLPILPLPWGDPCPPLLPAELRPSLFCFRFLTSFWVTSLQCRGPSSRKDGRSEELASLGELPAQAELSPCTPSQHLVLPNQGRAVRSLMGLCLLLAALLLSRVGTPQAGTCACSEVPMAPAASAGAGRAGLGLPHIPPGSTGSAWL